mgnify:CR=1 FL=1
MTEVVYHTTNQKDNIIIELANRCKSDSNKLVLLIPLCKEYSYQIHKAYEILSEDFLLYEFNMAMRTMLAMRAKKYVEYIKNAELYEVYYN